MRIHENPDFHLLFTLAPILEETDTYSLARRQLSTGTFHVTHNGACKFGMALARDTLGKEMLMIGVPEIQSAMNTDENLFDILLRVRIHKVYLVRSDPALYFVIRLASCESGSSGRYAVRIPTQPILAATMSRFKKVVLCRTEKGVYSPSIHGGDTIELDTAVLRARDWETKPTLRGHAS